MGCKDCGAAAYETSHGSIHIEHTSSCAFVARAQADDAAEDAVVEEYGSDDRMRALRVEACAAGDTATVRDCTAALDGDTLARVRCARAIADEAMRASDD